MIRRRMRSGKKEEVELLPLQDVEKLTMLETVNKIIELVENSGLSKDFYEKAAPYIKVLMEGQGITQIQSILVAVIAEATSMGNRASLIDMAEFVGCNGIIIMQYNAAIEELVRNGFLIKHIKFDDSVEYGLHPDFLEALANNRTFVRRSYAGCTPVSFLQAFFDLTHERHENRLSTDILCSEFQRLCEANPDLTLVKEVKKLDLETMDQLVLVQFCRHLALNAEADLSLENLSFLYDNKRERQRFESELNSDYSDLQLKELVERTCSDGSFSNDEFCLSEKGRKLLLKEFDLKHPRKVSGDLIRSSDIAKKDLFFSKEVQQQLEGLYGLLQEENYRNICARLKEKGLRQGFSCLFYGEPGTGKTESVLQLAQKTGRALMQVNIADIKSKWVGDSEKNVKAVFSRYKSLVEQSELAPILLFNEADAIIGKRKEGAERSVDKMENSIQNIILQEMETLEGIMIATTNLVQNMDSAFERRFLYKVRFEKPQLDQRVQIWHSMMPDLNEGVVSRLASTFDFSGGQIENIVRKCDVESILYGQEFINDEKIEQYCKEEKIIMKGNHQPIGFRI